MSIKESRRESRGEIDFELASENRKGISSGKT